MAGGSNPHVTNLKLRVSRNTLWAHLSAYPQLVEWFDSLTDGTTVHSPALAYRLRQDLSLVLESAAIAGNARSTQIIKRAVLVCIVQSLALEFAKRSGFLLFLGKNDEV